MSDNIDYDELDRAVRAASSARETAKEESKKASTKKPAAPAKRPVNHGVYMDFAPRRVTHKQVVRKTVVKPAPKITTEAPAPAAAKKKPIAAPITRLMNRPAVKAEPKTVAKPTVAPARPASKPVMQPRPAAPAPKPAAASRIEHQRPTPKPAPETAPAPALKRREAPNANNYSLGGRSPFVTNTHVEKRPLGANIPETSASALRSTRNVYSQKSPTRATENAHKHIVTQEPAGKSGWLWTLIVLGVIAAGGGLGYLAYLLIFAH